MTSRRSVSSYTEASGQATELVASHFDLVRRIAHHLAVKLPPSVQLEDLVQAGMIGLIEAARQFQTGQGATFATYAGIRIRGAMIDELRRSDWAPRSVHRNSRKIADTIQKIEGQLGRAASDGEIAAALGVTLNIYHEMLQDAASTQILGLEDLFGVNLDPDRLIPGNILDPRAQVEQGEFQNALAQALTDLPEKEKLVLACYYDEELNLREIGAIVGLTESRVSQIRSQALHRLRARLSNWI